MKNYYAVLGIQPDADDAEIKNAYRQSAKRYHPDLNPGNEAFKERFLLIKLAYETLENPVSRNKYDIELANARDARQAEQQAQAPQASANTSRQASSSAAVQRPSQAFNQSSQAQRPQNSHQHSFQQAKPTIDPRHVAIFAAQRKRQEAMQAEQRKTNLELQKQKVTNEELRQMYALQLELVRVAAKEELVKFKQRADERMKKLKIEFEDDRLKLKKSYEGSLQKLSKKMQYYKTEHKKSSFNAGFKEGIKSARESAQTTIGELKTLLNDANSFSTEKQATESAVQLRKLQLELSLLNETNRELMQQIKLNEQYFNEDMEKDEAMALSLEQANDRIEELVCERDALKLELNEYEDEINFLNEEILQLEGFVNMWRDISSDHIITDEEVELIEHYESSQRHMSKETYYGVLGLYLNALPEEIDTVYKRLCRRYQNKEAYTDKFLEIVAAYNILSDPIQKKAYDKSINNETDI